MQQEKVFNNFYFGLLKKATINFILIKSIFVVFYIINNKSPTQQVQVHKITLP